MMAALPEDRYDTRDILIDKQGMWHSRGMPVDAARALSQVDVVLNGLHGGIGEDGTVQRLLQRAGVPYPGSVAHASARSLNKIMARETLEKAGIQMPHALAFSVSDTLDTLQMAKLVFAEFGPPYIVKPASEGASIGIEIAVTIVDLPKVLGDVLDAFGSAIVEEYLIGDDATAGVIDDFRDEDVYALPPARIEYPDDSRHIHHNHHLNEFLHYIVPSDFSDSEKAEIADTARLAHRALGLSHFSRSDFIVTKHGPYLLEVNAYPGLYQGSAMPHILESVGSSVREFLEHIIHGARR